MGSGTKRNSSGQPQTAGTDGTKPIGSAEESVDDKQSEVTVRLTKINASVHSRTNRGDRATRDGPEVSVRDGVLGYIPQSALQDVEAAALSSGHVSDLSEEGGLSAAVTFTR